MPSLREYLPGISTQYWRQYQRLVAAPKTIIIAPGVVDQNILPTAIANERGLFSNFHIETDSADLAFTILIDDRKVTGTLSLLNDAGYVGYYIPGVPWLSKYDSTNNIYVANVIMEDLVPFYRNISVSVSNPSTSPIVIGFMEFNAYILKKGFYAELAKVVAGKENPVPST